MRGVFKANWLPRDLLDRTSSTLALVYLLAFVWSRCASTAPPFDFPRSFYQAAVAASAWWWTPHAAVASSLAACGAVLFCVLTYTLATLARRIVPSWVFRWFAVVLAFALTAPAFAYAVTVLPSTSLSLATELAGWHTSRPTSPLEPPIVASTELVLMRGLAIVGLSCLLTRLVFHALNVDNEAERREHTTAYTLLLIVCIASAAF